MPLLILNWSGFFGRGKVRCESYRATVTCASLVKDSHVVSTCDRCYPIIRSARHLPDCQDNSTLTSFLTKHCAATKCTATNNSITALLQVSIETRKSSPDLFSSLTSTESQRSESSLTCSPREPSSTSLATPLIQGAHIT